MSKRAAISRAANHNALQKLVTRFKPYWLLFTVFACIGLATAFIYGLFATHLYEASARVMIQDNKKGAETARQVEALDVLQSKKIIDNELDVIVSKPLLLEVINNLRLYAPVYSKSGFHDKLLYASAPVTIECGNPSSLFTSKKIPLSVDLVNNTVQVDRVSYTMGEWHGTPYGKLRFLKNPGY